VIIIKDQSGNNIVEIINVVRRDKRIAGWDKCMTSESAGIILGEYGSEERAKKVIGDIENHIEFVFSEALYYKREGGGGQIPNLIFVMPEE